MFQIMIILEIIGRCFSCNHKLPRKPIVQITPRMFNSDSRPLILTFMDSEFAHIIFNAQLCISVEPSRATYCIGFGDKMDSCAPRNYAAFACAWRNVMQVAKECHSYPKIVLKFSFNAVLSLAFNRPMVLMTRRFSMVVITGLMAEGLSSPAARQS